LTVVFDGLSARLGQPVILVWELPSQKEPELDLGGGERMPEEACSHVSEEGGLL